MSDTQLRARQATDLLREDHRAVKALFSDYEKTEDRSEKQDLFQKIRKELTLHMSAEEDVFYPALLEVDDEDGQELLKEAHEEHLIVRTLLIELSAMDAEDERFDAKVTVLGENVEHHAAEEEQELFPHFDELPKERQNEVSEQLEERTRDPGPR